jgi:hypothetical protein
MKVIIDGRFVLDEADLHRRLIRMALGTAAFQTFVATLEQVAAADDRRDRAERFVFRPFE